MQGSFHASTSSDKLRDRTSLQRHWCHVQHLIDSNGTVSLEALVFLKVNTDVAGDLLGISKTTGAGGSSSSAAGEEVAPADAATVVEVLDCFALLTSS